MQLIFYCEISTFHAIHYGSKREKDYQVETFQKSKWDHLFREYLFYQESNGELKGKSKFTKSIKTIMIPWDSVTVPRNWKSSEGPVFSTPTVGHFQASWLQTESKHGGFLKGWRCFIMGPTGGGSVGFVYWLLPLFQLLLVPFPGWRLIKTPKRRISKKNKTK